jgi:hypothetical protein
VAYNNRGEVLSENNQEGAYKASRESIVFKNSDGVEAVCAYLMRGESLHLIIKGPLGPS